MNTVAPMSIAYDSDTCTGCAACAAACPVEIISMRPDLEGFLRPQFNVDDCTNCGLCQNICPANGKNTLGETLKRSKGAPSPSVFAAWHLDETIRHASSSGGVFSALAEHILAQGGVVIGAALEDDLVVRHIIVKTTAELQRLRGSKYVQSEIAPDLYHQVRDILKRDIPVFFTGTPCQVAGIRSFLIKTYDNLFCSDIACHGVPSLLLFAQYVQDNQEKGNPITKVDFRDKTNGWKKFGVRRHQLNGGSTCMAFPADPYMLAFLRDYALRPSCYACKYANTNRPGDLTMADFWGVATKYPRYDNDDKGTSLILVSNEKGKTWLTACQKRLFLGPADLDTAIAGNPVLVRPRHRPPERDSFYLDLSSQPFSALTKKYNLYPPSLWKKMTATFIRRVKRVCRLVVKCIPKAGYPI